MITIIPAPAYALARTAWIPTLMLGHADGRLTRFEGNPGRTMRRRGRRARGAGPRAVVGLRGAWRASGRLKGMMALLS